MNFIEGDLLITRDNKVAYVFGFFHKKDKYYVYYKNPFNRFPNQYSNLKWDNIFGIDIIDKTNVRAILTPEDLTRAFLKYFSKNYYPLKKSHEKKPFFDLFFNTYNLFQNVFDINNFEKNSLLISDCRFLRYYNYTKKEFNPEIENEIDILLEKWFPVQLIIKDSLNISVFRQILRELIENKNVWKPFELPQIKKLYNLYPEEYKKHISFYTQASTDYRKLHNFQFNNTQFSFRSLENPSMFREKNYELDKYLTITPICELEINGQIKDNERWWNTPMVVKPDNITIKSAKPNENYTKFEKIINGNHIILKDIYSIFSHFEPNIESIRLLELFTAKGMVELVIPKKTIPKFITEILGINSDFPCLRLNLDYKPDYYILPK